MKKTIIVFLIAVLTVCLGLVVFVGCERENNVPTGLTIENGVLCWNKAGDAEKYVVKINDEEIEVNTNEYDLKDLEELQEYTFAVKSVSKNSQSKYSDTVKQRYYGKVQQDEQGNMYGYLGAFTNVNQLTSYLGYGIDPTAVSVVNERALHTGFPLFDIDQLMQQRLIVSGGFGKKDAVSEGRTFDEFMHSWNAGVDVNAEFGMFTRGAVGVSANYAGGSANSRYQYFYAHTLFCDAGSLAMQINDMDDYRAMLTSGFKKDLLNPKISPQELFNRYGSFFLSSCSVGGQIVIYYEMSSMDTNDFHEVTASIDTGIKTLFTDTQVDIVGGYQQIAARNNIVVKSAMEFVGGVDPETAILDEIKLPEIYSKWVSKVQANPALCGLKDSSSLVPIWELISDEDNFQVVSGGETTTRKEQLKNYFFTQGSNKYAEILKKYDIRWLNVEEISEVLVDGKQPAGEFDSLDMYDVQAGEMVSIDYKVVPANASETSLTFTVNHEQPHDDFQYTDEDGKIHHRKFTSKDADGNLEISADAPEGHMIKLDLSIGGIHKTIVLRVVKYRTVNFNTYCSLNLPPLLVQTGNTISEPSLVPEDCNRTGYLIEGWYLDKEFTRKVSFPEWGVFEDTTLHAHWVKEGEETIPKDSTIIVELNNTICVNDNDGNKYSENTEITDPRVANHAETKLFNLSINGCKQNEDGSLSVVDSQNVKFGFIVLQDPRQILKKSSNVGDYLICGSPWINYDTCSSVIGTSINKQIGMGAYAIQVVYKDNTTASFFGVNILDGKTVGDYISISDGLVWENVKSIKITVVFEMKTRFYGFLGIQDNWTTAYRSDTVLNFEY